MVKKIRVVWFPSKKTGFFVSGGEVLCNGSDYTMVVNSKVNCKILKSNNWPKKSSPIYGNESLC